MCTIEELAFALFLATALFCVQINAGEAGPGISMNQLKEKGISSTDLFVSGTERVKQFRIPSLITTKKGTLLAVCDARVDRPGDVPNNVDQVFKRSTDGGVTWTPMKVAVDFPGREGAADPSLLQDRDTGTIWLAYVYCPGRTKDPKLAKILSKRRILELHLLKSDDDGVTWSKPINLQPKLKTAKYLAFWPGPGRGIQTRAGKLIIPVSNYYDRRFHSYLVESSDHGATWSFSKSGPVNINEPTLVEKNNGDLMLICRNGNRGTRGTSMSKDGGATWSAVQEPKDMRAPNCQGSTIVYSAKKDGGERDIWIHSTPGHFKNRAIMTLRVSLDEGETWPVVRIVDSGKAAYSCLTKLSGGDIGLLWERPYSKIIFSRMTLDYVLSGKGDSH